MHALVYPWLTSEQGECSARVKRPRPQGDRLHPAAPSKATEPNPTWWAPVFITLLVLGLLWIVVYYVTSTGTPSRSIGVWNLGVGFACSWAASS